MFTHRLISFVKCRHCQGCRNDHVVVNVELSHDGQDRIFIIAVSFMFRRAIWQDVKQWVLNFGIMFEVKVSIPAFFFTYLRQ